MGPEHFTPTVRHGVWLYILAPACRRVTRSWLPGSAPGPPPRTREASGLAQPTRPVNTKAHHQRRVIVMLDPRSHAIADRKSTRLNSSHTVISYAVFCLKKK